jgi:hypothetical protein
MNRALMATGLVDRVQVTHFPRHHRPDRAEPDLNDAADFDLELLETRTLDGRTQELVYRPTLHWPPGRRVRTPLPPVPPVRLIAPAKSSRTVMELARHGRGIRRRCRRAPTGSRLNKPYDLTPEDRPLPSPVRWVLASLVQERRR